MLLNLKINVNRDEKIIFHERFKVEPFFKPFGFRIPKDFIFSTIIVKIHYHIA